MLLRHAFATVIAILTLSGCETVQTIDKGLYHATEAVTQEDRVTGRRSLSVQDRTQQIELGNKAAVDTLAEYPAINADVDAKQYERARTIFARVHAVSHMRDESWAVALVPDDSFNAFVTGGTYVIVHKGLMTRLSTDDEVAAVLGHELAHVAANHVFEQQAHTLAAGIARSKSASTDRFSAAYDHEQEREADRIGILYSALAGYDPRAAGRLWQAKFKAEGDFRVLPSGKAPLHTHPVNSERASEAARVGDLVAAYYIPGQSNPQSAEILLNNVLWTLEKDNLQESAGNGGGVLAALGTALNAYSDHLNAKVEASRQQQRAQLVQYVDRSSVILAQRAINDTAWEITFQYRGALTLNRMVIAADLLLPGNKQIRIIREIAQDIPSGSTHVLQFSDDRLKGVEKSQLKVAYTVDDASQGPSM